MVSHIDTNCNNYDSNSKYDSNSNYHFIYIIHDRI